MDEELSKKYGKLKQDLINLESVAVAFSAGVDSTFLLAVAAEVLGEKAVAVTELAAWVPQREVREAAAFCESRGIRQICLHAEIAQIDGYAENPPNRCYLCKRNLFTKIAEVARENGLAYVAEGSNVDDLGDYRPGLKATAELGVKSPLREAGLTKAEIRELSHRLGLPTADKPSFACLSSRIPYGERITEKKLSMAEQGEQLLYDKGFHQFRVRVHGSIARIELLPDEIGRAVKEPLRTELYDAFLKLGFSYVTLDLRGYRMGSMNEQLAKR